MSNCNDLGIPLNLRHLLVHFNLNFAIKWSSAILLTRWIYMLVILSRNANRDSVSGFGIWRAYNRQISQLNTEFRPNVKKNVDFILIFDKKR